jgi:hypothetical protein
VFVLFSNRTFFPSPWCVALRADPFLELSAD